MLLLLVVGVVMLSSHGHGHAVFLRDGTGGRAGEYAAPTQIHVAVFDSDTGSQRVPGGVTISWATAVATPSSSVRFGLSSTALTHTQKSARACQQYEFCTYHSPFLHHVTIQEGLVPSTTYYYQCGDDAAGWSPIHTFTTAPALGSEEPLLFAFIGDLGQTDYSKQTLRHIDEFNLSAIIHAGDLSYADSYQPRWDTWGDLVEPVASQKHWMVAAGNHEEEQPCRPDTDRFVAYQSRFRMPFDDSDPLQTGNLYYAFRYGMVHFIVLTPYIPTAPSSKQYQWLEAELKRVDRKLTPWLAVIMHGPWYNSNTAHQGAEPHHFMKIDMEDILFQYNVDVVLAGHVHAYERTHPVYHEQVRNDGIVYVVIGDGGNREGLAKDFLHPQPQWSAFRRANYGFGLFRVANTTHAAIEWYENAVDGEATLRDTAWICSTHFRVKHTVTMSAVKVSIKWGKQVFEDIVVDKSASVDVLKAQIYALTMVPVDRQKLMSKAWKGMLKDDTNLATLDKLVDGTSFMLMGSAEVVEKPKEEIIFIEDLTTKEVAASGTVYPAGLVNLGNTCYMNATLQCLRPVKELREAMKKHSGGISSDIANNFTTALRDLYAQMDTSLESVTPALFVSTLRRSFPQFAQQAPRGGGFMQQDSEEFLSVVFNTMSRTLTTPVGIPSLESSGNMVDALFGLEMSQKLTCTETDMETPVVKTERAMKLVCNITIDTNHLTDGVKIGLEGTIEKHSDVLGRNAVWKKESRINRLPKYLCVQFMRFYWKLTPESRDHAGVKCKMLRPISFPQILDTYDFCSDELKATMKVARDKNAEKILNEFKESKGNAEEEKKDEEMEGLSAEDAAALEAAKSMSMGAVSPGIGLPADFQGNYELYAILTHKGRSADSGHYMAWVREKGGKFYSLCRFGLFLF
ncbi:TPA: hypothetical protein N0F65_002409 [Lagenidium giganteum]|uniref:Multifunctional fusion protein n=1 Tax=Lagenidium giganteum TaxID=4803 RepID=A0AAV2YLN5_9STRA|nr:TPA: hypothetical protein N0F65_002409 [Lagenidium giganteum]